MLKKLYIENLAVISRAELELGGGLNIFTGETGAGKTVLISAVGAVMGQRVQKDIIRTGESRATVSAVFSALSEAAVEMLGTFGYEPDEDGTLLITRTVRADSSDCRINGQPATAAILKALSPMLIDLHGQHDNARLLSPEYHLSLIDRFGGLQKQGETYREAYDAMCAARDRLQTLTMDEGERARRVDLLQYQVEEIDRAQLVSGEEEELESSRTLMRNAEKISTALSAAKELLSPEYGEQSGIEEQLAALGEALGIAARYIPSLESSAARLTEMSYELAEWGRDLTGYLESVDFSPRQLDETEERLSLIHSLKTKYGPSVDEILRYGENARQELETITFSQQKLQRLESAYQVAGEKAQKAADKLSSARKAAGIRFTRAVEKELVFLDMPSVKLTAAQEKKALGPWGQDAVELLVSVNPGEPPRPVHKTASGGEISRIMLSIKNAMAAADDAVTSIFDEVDTGVSGRAADKIGYKLWEVARGRQVLCVTHLAQVASYGDTHLLIQKNTADGRTFTQVCPLSEEERVRELARIISGDAVTDAAVSNATEMLAAAKRKESGDVGE